MVTNIQIKKLNDKALMPSYETSGASGFDISSIEDVIIKGGDRALIRTGLSFCFSSSYEVQIRPRSGLAFNHGITVLNSPGTIDSDYRGEVKILLINLSKIDFAIKRGDRIAQGVIQEVVKAKFSVVKKLEDTKRGENGFGSTGR